MAPSHDNHLVAHYPAAQQRFDELLGPDGFPRPHWAPLVDALSAESPERLRQRIDTVDRQVRENGVTYNVYDDPRGMERPWELDAMPFILPAQEWGLIEAAVCQRATLLNRLLGDIYGAQSLLAAGLLPPALIHGNAGFLRPCHGIRQAGDVALQFLAVDLARSPDGQWWVVSDRTQAPSGVGYALENRNVMSRVFPDLMRAMQVPPIDGFFDSLRASLTHRGTQCARATGDSAGKNTDAPPLIVLLTPGPYNETYYEQAALARHLGFPLVEGRDLAVREGMVWLRTLSGPQRVHVILRRVDDDYCDPLELRPESALGVAGLTEAARRGAVVIANGLGSNLLESGALLGYLPALCRHLLGESLRLPSVATWWCGEPAALETVVKGLDGLLIKPAFPQLRMAQVYGQDLDAHARAALVAAMRAQPNDFVAQETVRISQAPVWRGDGVGSGSGSGSSRDDARRNNVSAGSPPGFDASAIGLRVYACATEHGYVVMPGALARVATGPDARVIDMQRGGASKDTWIQGMIAPYAPRAPRQPLAAADLSRGDARLSTRVVENLFWYGRYAERCDNVARLLRTALDCLHTEGNAAEWPAVQSLCVRYGLIGAAVQYGAPPMETASASVADALLDAVVATTDAGLAGNLAQLQRVAGHLRERFSPDHCRVLNRLAQHDAGPGQRPTLAVALGMLNETLARLMTLSGFATDGMTRDQGWRFMSIGRRLERLQFTSRTLAHALAMPPQGRLDWLLGITDSIVTYRARYAAQPEWLPVLDLLVLDEGNPRALACQLSGLTRHLPLIAQASAGALDGSNATTRFARLTRLHAQVLALDPQRDLQPAGTLLPQLLHELDDAAAGVSEQLGQRYFSNASDPAAAAFPT